MYRQVTEADAAGLWTLQTSIFPRTAQAWPCTTRRGSARSVCVNASPDTTTSGATPSCWNVDARTENSLLARWPAPTDPAARTLISHHPLLVSRSAKH